MNALSTLSRTFFFTILLGLLAAPGALFAQNQTNDPLVDEQQYLFDVHRVGQAWNYTTGASTVKIGIYSQTGFIQNHEDFSSSRLAAPVGALQDPAVDIASEMAGIVGASTNNGVGMAGIDRAATLQSYSVLTETRTCDDDSRCQENRDRDEEEPVTFERPDGTQETYYLNLYRFSDQIKQGRNNGVDVHLVSFGLPSGDAADYSLEGPEAPNPFMDLSDIAPSENPNPDPYGTLGTALLTTIKRIGKSICGGWFGSCMSPPDPSSLFRDQVGFAVAKDEGVVVTPAGNLNGDGDLPPRYLPGMFDPYAVTVGGVEFNDQFDLVEWDRTRPANYVDVAAFAEDVVGLSGAGPKQYDTSFSSTAASASIGAGVSSLLKAEMASLSGEDIEEVLRRTARDAGAPGEDDATGTGAIDAEAALAFIRSNDVQRSKKSVRTVISDDVVGTDIELRGNGFHDYTSKNCYQVKGDLHKFRARVPYSQTFSQAPDAWVRWGESDGLLSSGRVDGAYYDPLQKNLRVVEADRTGLTVEGYYWTADFYNRYGQRCARGIPIPKQPANFEVAYTAVGTEGPPPLEVSLSGPTSLDHGEQGTWTASVSGGTGSTTSYDWAYQSVASSTWQEAYCSGASCSRAFPNTGSEILTAEIRVTATSGKETDVAHQSVNILPSEDGCADPTAPCLNPITLSKQAPSIRLYDVQAQARPGQRAGLQWATTGVSDGGAFVVQHRADSTASWARLGTVPVGDSVENSASRGIHFRFQTDRLNVGRHQFRLRVRTSGPKRAALSPVVTAAVQLQDAYQLSVYPNPVRRRATVGLAVKERQSVIVQVYDVLGRRTATLHDGVLPGQETRRFRLHASEVGLSSGTYFVRVRGETFSATRTMTVVK